MVVGDSLSAAYGIPVDQGWVSLLQRRLRSAGYQHQVLNASISGDTTRGGVSRLPQALAEHRPEVVIIQLGGNDGLRGFGPEQTRRHLLEMIRLARAARAKVLLLGVQLPANYGNEFRSKFHHVYLDLADQETVPLVPFFLDGVAQDLTLMQADGIHPGGAAQSKILDNIWPALTAILSADS